MEQAEQPEDVLAGAAAVTVAGVPALDDGLVAPHPPGPTSPRARRRSRSLAARADQHAVAARSTRTCPRTAYAADWAHFTGWCDLSGLSALPASVDTVRLYLTDLEAARDHNGAMLFAPSTMARRLAAIAGAHRDTGHPSPTRDSRVGAVLTGIRAYLSDELRWTRNGSAHSARYRQEHFHGHPPCLSGALDSDYGGHFLLRGFATSASAGGAAERAVQNHGRWRSPVSTAPYVDEAVRYADTNLIRVLR